MASKYLQKFPIPEKLPEILHDYAKVILRDQPEDIIQYSAEYFECLAAGKEFVGESKFNVVQPEVPDDHGKEYYEKSIKPSDPKHAPRGTAEKKKITKPPTPKEAQRPKSREATPKESVPLGGEETTVPAAYEYHTERVKTPGSKPQRPPSGRPGSRPGSKEGGPRPESKERKSSASREERKEERPSSKYSGKSNATEMTHKTEKELGNDYLNELGDFAIEKLDLKSDARSGALNASSKEINTSSAEANQSNKLVSPHSNVTEKLATKEFIQETEEKALDRMDEQLK